MRKKINREKRMCCCLNIWIAQTDIQKLKEQAAKSTCGSFSEFVRRLLLKKQTVILYRDEALDHFLDEAVLLRNEMSLLRQTRPWTPDNERRLIALMENIQSIILKIYEQCKHK